MRSTPNAHFHAQPQSLAAVHAHLLRWGIITNLNYRALDLVDPTGAALAPLHDYLKQKGMVVLVRSIWDDAYHQGVITLLFDTARYTFAQARGTCERDLFAEHGCGLWTAEDERQAERIRQDRARQKRKRLAIDAWQAKKHK